MRIGILVARLPSERTGGAELQASRLAKHLAQDHEVTVLTRSRAVPPELAALPLCDVLRRCPVNLPGVRFGADIVSTLRLIGSRRKSLDVLVAFQTIIDGLIGALARVLFRIPVMVSVRSEKEYQLGRNLRSRLLSPFVFRHADRIAVQSATIRRELLEELVRAGRPSLSEYVNRKLCIVPNGVTLRGDEPANGDVILYVGRLVKVKGVKFLIEAMRDCPKETLIIVGDGPERSNLRRAAAGLDNVSFVGSVYRDKVDEYLARAKILVLPSLRDEGLPNVIMEAMVRGVPVVATRGAGVPDLVQHGETGFLTEPGDAKALAHYINTIAADTDLHSRLGRNSLREMSRYSWTNVLQSWERELNSLATRTDPGAL